MATPIFGRGKIVKQKLRIFGWYVFIIIVHPDQVSDLKTDPTPTAPSVDNTSAADREKLENALEEQIIQTLQTQKELARYKVLTWNLFPVYMQYRLEK